MIRPAPGDPIRKGRELLTGRPSLPEALLEERAAERKREGKVTVRASSLEAGTCP